MQLLGIFLNCKGGTLCISEIIRNLKISLIIAEMSKNVKGTVHVFAKGGPFAILRDLKISRIWISAIIEEGSLLPVGYPQ